jgi:hypothetical protein
MNRIFYFFLFLLCLWMPQTAFAGRCDAAYEVIVSPYEPSFGVPTVWDAEYGEEGKMIQMMSSVTREGGTILSVGRVLNEKTYQPEEVILTELNRRGRAILTKRFPAKNAEAPTKIIEVPNGYLVSSNITAGRKKDLRQVRIMWLDKNVSFKKEIIIKDSQFNYEGMDLLPAADGNGFIVLVRAENRGNPQDYNSVLLHYTDSGTLSWKRAYRPGIPNSLHGIIPLDNGKNYLAVGEIKIDDNRMAGWVLKLGIDGTMFWQRAYPRGASSVLKAASRAPYSDLTGDGFILLGTSAPLDRGPVATWVLSVSASGEVTWQRYFRRDDSNMIAEALSVEDDGRIMMMINAEMMENLLGADHIRLLTLSPRGALIRDEAYLSGEEAKANDYVEGWQGERIVTSTIRKIPVPQAKQDIIGSGLFRLRDRGEDKVVKAEGEDAAEEKLPDPQTRGWVFVATALDAYEDPCRIK